MVMVLGCDYGDHGFNPEPESVPVPDPTRDDFGQEDVWYLVHTTVVFLRDIWGSHLADQQ